VKHVQRIRRHGWLLCLIALLAWPGTNAVAQDVGRPAQGGARGGRQAGVGPAAGMPVAELERLFDGLELVEARRALGLDDAQYLRFAQRLQRLQTMRAQHRVRRMALLRELRTTAPPATAEADQAARARLEAFDQLQVQQAREVLRAQAAVDEVLTLEQRIEFRLFQERFERRKLSLLAQAQARGAGPEP